MNSPSSRGLATRRVPKVGFRLWSPIFASGVSCQRTYGVKGKEDRGQRTYGVEGKEDRGTAAAVGGGRAIRFRGMNRAAIPKSPRSRNTVIMRFCQRLTDVCSTFEGR